MSVVAVPTNAQLNEDQLLGSMVFYTIDENVKIDKTDLADLFQKCGLSMNFLPDEIKPHDAFRRATSVLTGTLEINTDSGGKATARFLVREVKHDSKHIVRHLVREIVDAKNEVLDYATVGKMVFSRATADMGIGWDPAYLNEYPYNGVLKNVKNLYHELTQYHNKDTINNISTRIIKSMNPVSIQPRGRAQFIPKYAHQTLYAFKQMIESLPGNSIVDIIPLIDTQEQRALIQRRAEYQLKTDTEELVATFTDLLSRGSKISVKQMQDYMQKFIALQERVKDYQKLLQRNLQAVSLQIQQAIQLVESSVPDEEDEDVEQLDLAL
jgi:ElaB/YqjD/DUF883 family membrane-anchored ribosome-binding protein